MAKVFTLNARYRVSSPVKRQIESVMERLRGLLGWLENNGRNVPSNSFQTGSKELTGLNLVVILSELTLGPDQYKDFEKEYEAIQAD